jgi:hypothetical protein
MSGFSGKGGRIYMSGACPTSSAGSEGALEDEVTHFNITDNVNMRRYGHDKSGGWQAAVPGTRGLQITIEAMLAAAPSGPATPNPGQSIFLSLVPGVHCGHHYEGHAIVESVAIRVNIETGDPVGYTMTCVSNGPWTGLGANIDVYTCACSLGR